MENDHIHSKWIVIGWPKVEYCIHPTYAWIVIGLNLNPVSIPRTVPRMVSPGGTRPYPHLTDLRYAWYEG